MNDEELRYRFHRYEHSPPRQRPVPGQSARPASQPEPTKPVNTVHESLPLAAHHSKPLAKQPGSHRKSRLVLAAIGLAAIALAVSWYLFIKTSSPVPKNVANGVNFPVYYPNPEQLPAGYQLDQSSFTTPRASTVLYSVDYGSDQKLVFSVEPKPPADQLQTLINSSIASKSQYQTAVGTATIGTVGSQTVALLPAPKALLIVTAPQSINLTDFKQVLSSIKP